MAFGVGGELHNLQVAAVLLEFRQEACEVAQGVLYGCGTCCASSADWPGRSGPARSSRGRPFRESGHLRSDEMEVQRLPLRGILFLQGQQQDGGRSGDGADLRRGSSQNCI